ncbi:MAG: glucokinase [Woeseiaceae bacterium]|nr:glucokinase [Woeseiaceae bacterium]
MAQSSLLIGDIGGTNARFALADTENVGFRDALTLKCADFASVDAAIQQYLQQTSAAAPSVICLAAAGPLIGDSIKVTNNHWAISPKDVGSVFGIESVRLLNDFEALAYSIPFLGAHDYTAVGLPLPRTLADDEFNIAIIGPGTGLGTAGLCRRGDLLIPISGEGGHVGFAPESQVQIEVLKVLRERFERVSAERLVSGSGIENIYNALTLIHGEKKAQLTAAEVFAAAATGNDPRAVETVGLFFDVFGQVAGDLALVLDARDGVFIAGGIAKRYPDLLAGSGFRNAFESKGRHRALMESIPTQLVTHDEPGLLGSAYCALELSCS